MSVPPSLAAVPPWPTAARGDPPVDAGSVRFAAAITTAVLTLALLSGSNLLLAAQATVFGVGAVAGLRFAPYAVAFRSLMTSRPRPAGVLQDSAPVRFSEAVGAVLTTLGVVGHLTGLTIIGLVATVLALAVAFLAAAFGYRPGREIHALITRGHRPHRTTIHNQQGAST